MRTDELDYRVVEGYLWGLLCEAKRQGDEPKVRELELVLLAFDEIVDAANIVEESDE